MNDDVRRDLEAAGRRPVPEPRPEFAAALEARLLAVARTAVPVPPPTPGRRRPAFRLAAGFASIAVVLGLVVVLGGNGVRSPDLELTGAVGVEVALSDGTTLIDPDGLLLPDGAIVRVGPAGSARIGNVTLHGGDVATVVDQRLRLDRQPGSQAVVPGGSPTPRPVTTPTPTGTPPPSGTPAAPTAPLETEQPTDRLPTATPNVSPPPTPSPVRTPEPSATTAPPKPTPSPAVSVKPLKLQARAVGKAEIGATWTAAPGASRYVLIASRSKLGPAPDPRYAAASIVGAFTRPPVTPLLFRVGVEIVEVRLQVIALDAGGAVIARSNIVTVSLPG